MRSSLITIVQNFYPKKKKTIVQNCLDDDACKSPDICGEGETCENAPGLGYRCNPKPKIIKPDKTPVLQGECPLFNFKPE